MAWFEDIDGGGVTSVSFAHESTPFDDPEHFHVPNFLVGTRRSLIIGMQAAMFEELSPDDRRGTLIVQGMDDEVHGLAPHPFLSQFLSCTYSGDVQLWDYVERQLLLVRHFDVAKLRPHCVAVDPRGRFAVVGFTNGALKVMGVEKLDDTQAAFRHSENAITEIQFSQDGGYMATADADRCVALYRYMRAPVRKTAADASMEDDSTANNAPQEVEQWVYLGRNRSHSRPITSLRFGSATDGTPLLVSVGEDRRVVEYDVTNSSIAAGILLRGDRTRVGNKINVLLVLSRVAQLALCFVVAHVFLRTCLAAARCRLSKRQYPQPACGTHLGPQRRLRTC